MADSRTYSDELELKAYLNELTTDVDNDYTVKVQTKQQTLTDEDIAQDMALLSGKYTRSEILHLLDLQAQVVGRAAANGYNVATRTFYMQPMASGVVMEEELSLPIDREKVKVYANFRAGTAIKEAMQQAKLTLFTQPAVTGPYIAGMVSATPVDPVTNTRAPMASAEMAVITGNGLKVTGTDPSVGVTLTSVTDPSKSFFIPASKISPNTPKKLQFVLPAGVTDGEWMVKVTTQYMSGGGSQTKHPRSFELKRPVVIGAAAPGGDGPSGGGDTPSGGDSGDQNENPLG